MSVGKKLQAAASGVGAPFGAMIFTVGFSTNNNGIDYRVKFNAFDVPRKSNTLTINQAKSGKTVEVNRTSYTWMFDVF